MKTQKINIEYETLVTGQTYKARNKISGVYVNENSDFDIKVCKLEDSFVLGIEGLKIPCHVDNETGKRYILASNNGNIFAGDIKTEPFCVLFSPSFFNTRDHFVSLNPCLKDINKLFKIIKEDNNQKMKMHIQNNLNYFCTNDNNIFVECILFEQKKLVPVTNILCHSYIDIFDSKEHEFVNQPDDYLLNNIVANIFCDVFRDLSKTFFRTKIHDYDFFKKYSDIVKFCVENNLIDKNEMHLNFEYGNIVFNNQILKMKKLLTDEDFIKRTQIIDLCFAHLHPSYEIPKLNAVIKYKNNINEHISLLVP